MPARSAIAHSAIQTPIVRQVDEKALREYEAGPDAFFAGPDAAVPGSIESRIEFGRDQAGKIASLTWRREGVDARSARRVDDERREDVRLQAAP